MRDDKRDWKLFRAIRGRLAGRRVNDETAGKPTSVIDGQTRMSILERLRSKTFNTKGTTSSRTPVPKRTGIFGRLRQPGRFFSPERIKERHDFRIKVSGNRKWIMIGVAVLAVCATIIYLSITYGGGGLGFLKGLL